MSVKLSDETRQKMWAASKPAHAEIVFLGVSGEEIGRRTLEFPAGHIPAEDISFERHVARRLRCLRLLSDDQEIESYLVCCGEVEPGFTIQLYMFGTPLVGIRVVPDTVFESTVDPEPEPPAQRDVVFNAREGSIGPFCYDPLRLEPDPQPKPADEPEPEREQTWRDKPSMF